MIMAAGATKMQALRATPDELSHTFPHDQVVAAMLVKAFIGSSKLVDCTFAEMKKDSRCDRLRAQTGLNNEAEIALKDRVVDVVEKGYRLRRNTVPASRSHVEIEKVPYRISR